MTITDIDGMFRHCSCLIWLVLGSGISALPPESVAASTFEDEVAPILQRHCLSCHQDGEAQGDLSLSSARGLLEAGFIDIDDVDASYLLEVVTPHDGKAAMPKDSKPLSTEEIGVLRRWIENGAKWPDGYTLEPLVVTDRDWWSLRPIAAGDKVELEVEQGNPVDAFVDAKLVEQGLAPVEQADPLSLIRRVTYDLTGLPPTPTEVSRFLINWRVDPDATWKAVVDRLLSSPAFGEKWGQHWLDVARYAETHGYDKDKPRTNAWPYRDYVIRSFNEDKPYSRFVQEQIAGDWLYPKEPDGILGLGFLAAGPWDFIGHWEVGEGKLDGRIAKHLDRDEMVSAVFNVFMSTTVQCAQCHHHKFDPIRMEDYYRLHAVLAAVDRADRVYDGLSLEQQQHKQLALSSLSELKSEKKALISKVESEVAVRAAEIDRRIAELREEYGTGTGPEPQYGYHSQIAKTRDETKWVQLDLGQPREVDGLRIHPAFDMFAGIGAGFGFPVRYRVEASNDATFRDGVRLLHDATAEDQPNPGTLPVVVHADDEPMRFLRVTATKLRERRNDYIFALGEIAVFDKDEASLVANKIEVTALDSIESGLRWGRANLIDGVFFQELTDLSALAELQELRDNRVEIATAARTAEIDERLDKIDQRLDSLNKELKAIPDGRLVYAAATHFPRGGQFTATEGKPRKVHLLHRGDLRSPREEMSPGTLPIWENAPDVFALSKPESRRDHDGTDWNEAEARGELARYLTRDDNPLLWRSIANRLWLWTFGAPLVGTPNDFGRGGMEPTHPELLDYLAARLRDDPQHSLKSIIRLLVTSEMYRRSSRVDARLAQHDAGNAYWWRANRRRLTAEEFRDSLLVTAGVLQRTMGGPSFQDFVIEKPEHSPHYEYHLHDPADAASHRRSVYRFVVRSQPQPLLTTLDCADPSISSPRRDESTTALQALAAWNNRLVEFAAGKLGAKLDQEGTVPSDVVGRACQLVLGRGPSSLEATVLGQHLEDHGTASLSRVLFNMNAFIYLD